MTSSLILQGPFSTRFFESYDHYCDLFDEIVISTYGEHAGLIAQHWPRLARIKTKIILNSAWVPDGVDNHGNAWYQAMTTATGLRAATGHVAVKARMDESWSNMRPVLDQVCQQPNMMHSLNVYFRKDSELKYHVSDHLYAGDRKNLLAACEIVMRWCANRPTMINLWREMAWSECMLGAAWVTIAGYAIDPNKSQEQMLGTVKIIPIQQLGSFCFTSATEGLTYHSVEDIAACQRVGPGMTNWLHLTTEEFMR
jgi:hypothetical protein